MLFGWSEAIDALVGVLAKVDTVVFDLILIRYPCSAYPLARLLIAGSTRLVLPPVSPKSIGVTARIGVTLGAAHTSLMLFILRAPRMQTPGITKNLRTIIRAPAVTRYGLDGCSFAYVVPSPVAAFASFADRVAAVVRRRRLRSISWSRKLIDPKRVCRA